MVPLKLQESHGERKEKITANLPNQTLANWRLVKKNQMGEMRIKKRMKRKYLELYYDQSTNGVARVVPNNLN